MSKSDKDIELAFLCIGLGLYFVYEGIKRYRRTRLVQDSADITIASAPQGMVEIQGYAWPKQETSVTLHGRRAVYHYLELQRKEGSGKNSKWVTCWEKKLLETFFVLDRTGVAELNPMAGDIEVFRQQHSFRSLSATALEQMPTLNITVPGFPPSTGVFGLITSSNFRFLERAILIGSPIYAHGTFVTKQTKTELPPTLALKRFRQFLGRMKGTRIAKQLQLDMNHDGFVSEEEARTSLNQIGQESLDGKPVWNQQPAILPGEKLLENTVYGEITSSSERKLFVADCHQDHLLSRIGSNNIARIIGGALLVGAGVFYLIMRCSPRG